MRVQDVPVRALARRLLVPAERVAQRRKQALVALSVALGLVHGALNGAGLEDAGRDATGLLGIVATVFVVLALVSALVVSLRQPWTRIAVRVAGSWVAAVGLLMAGWGIRAALA